jgi:hypothetical protein
MEKNTGPGIDYSGGGCVNRDNETGIHYGVISQNEVLQAWCDSSEPYYGKPKDGEDELPEDAEPLSYEYDGDGYQASCGEDGDIFIIKSPYYTFCGYCSPCAPGAGYIMSTREEGIKAYCFGHDWFDDEKAPYPVYDVKTNLEVKAS